MTDYFVWIILHLGAWALILLASAGAGVLFLRNCRFDSLLERAVFTIAAGMGCWGVLLFLLGLAGLLYSSVIIGLTVAAAAATVVYLLRTNRHVRFKLPDWREHIRPRGLLIASVFIIGVIYWLLLLLLTQYPPMNWDSVAYHLVLAKEYLRNHSIIVHDGIAVPVVPALNHILFTWGLAMKDDVMAHMIEHTFLMLTALGTYAWGRRQNQPWMGLAAAALWLGHPLIVWLGEAAYVDLGVTGFVFLGLYALRVFWESREVKWWYLAMSLLGMAAAVKLPGLFFAALASALGLWVLLRPRIKWGRLRSLMRSDHAEQKDSIFTWRPLVLGWALALFFTAPFYGFIAYATGNPFWPGFPELSQGIWQVGAET
ncbi:MAG TPA: glycosyltransferase family 39 protein, partial [Blastocatellia bacterium]|nr:glycosyltransferase family 39 protein [Blastocatellia bacterium]